jgi:hypothetical protein
MTSMDKAASTLQRLLTAIALSLAGGLQPVALVSRSHEQHYVGQELTTLIPMAATSSLARGSGATEDRILLESCMRSFCCFPTRFNRRGPGKRIKRKQANACEAEGGHGTRSTACTAP